MYNILVRLNCRGWILRFGITSRKLKTFSFLDFCRYDAEKEKKITGIEETFDFAVCPSKCIVLWHCLRLNIIITKTGRQRRWTIKAWRKRKGWRHINRRKPQSWEVRQHLRTQKVSLSFVSWFSVSLRLSVSVRLHSQLSQITAVVRLCCSIRQLHLSENICRRENRITGRSMYATGTIGGAVVISPSGNRNTSSWPLYVTSCLGIRERWRTKSETKLHLCTLRICCSW